jgi:hypothetical protein
VLLTGLGTIEAQEKPIRRVTATVTLDVEPFAGIIMHPLPPNTASQRLVSWEMIVKTSKGTSKAEPSEETGPFKKRILTVRADPNEKMQVVVKLELDLFKAPGPVKAKMPPTLTEKEQIAYTDVGPFYEHDTEAFRSWMKANDLLKKKKESDSQFALRVLTFMRTKFNYKIPDDKYMRAKIKERGTGELGFFISEWSGECWALSRVYTCVLRANGIPSRQVSGRMLDGGHHVRAEVFLESVGWIHVELAGSVTNKKANVAEFFGRDGSNMIVMNEGINFSLPGPKGTGNVGTFSMFALCKEDAAWEFPFGTWSLSDRKK